MVGLEIGVTFEILVDFGIEIGFGIVLNLEMDSILHQIVILVQNK